MNELRFPKGFYWGAASAAFQVEGATQEDGRGESIWDRFCATPGKILTGETGDPAADSYHRYPEDIALMKEMGLNAYRFSISWPRILPDGETQVNQKGLAYYQRLVDALLEAGIQPMATLYHWDLPQKLQDKGGWANRATLDAFARYSDVVAAALGDRVKFWATTNEPWCAAFLGNEYGEHAPGNRDRALALQVAHNLLLSHGMAVPVIRQRCPDGKVGIALNMNPFYPATDSSADSQLARDMHASFTRWFLDPVAGRGYPQAVWDYYGADVPEILPGDMETIAAPLDFLGLNYYTRSVVHDPEGGEEGQLLNIHSQTHQTSRDWEVYPQGLYDLLISLGMAYDFKEIYITENGAAYEDSIARDGKVHDALRIDYIHKHLSVIHRAIQAGVPVRGYLCWSLLDNFEWSYGTSSRFGLVHVDFATQKRTLKDSGGWYGKVARENRLID